MEMPKEERENQLKDGRIIEFQLHEENFSRFIELSAVSNVNNRELLNQIIASWFKIRDLMEEK